MWRKLAILLLVVLTFFITPTAAKASYDPTSVSNNRFGIHIVEPSDLDDVARLLNSNGGDWGYVTLVIQKGERDTRRWQEIFDKMRRLHLIPIVRVATAPIGNTWEKPNPDKQSLASYAGEIDGWVSFFDSLNWVIKNRYITIGNEPNHAKEWGGQINPKEYADYLETFSQKLKASSSDYFIMPAGFDASAGNTFETMDEERYLSLMLAAQPNLFDNIDGWASHSYPNPGFSGSEDGVGRGSVRTYLWEIGYLKSIGITKNLPVFITETGWVHNAGGRIPKNPDPTTLGPKYETAYKYAWNGPGVVAVTPFVFNYQDSLFDMFSWKKKDGGFYDFYYAVQKLNKIKGNPIQENKGEIISAITPALGNTGSTFYSLIFVRNTGQAIWERGNFEVRGEKGSFEISSFLPHAIEPGQIGIISVRGKLSNETGSYKDSFVLFEGKEVSGKYGFEIKVLPFITFQIIIEDAKNFILDKILPK